MKFKEIEPKRNSVESELDATPYVLSEEEQKMVAGGNECGTYIYCGNLGENSCAPYICDQKRTSCTVRRTWMTESFIQE